MIIAIVCLVNFWSLFVYLGWYRLTFNTEPTILNITTESQDPHFIDKCMDVMRFVPNNPDYDDARDWRFSWCVEQNNIRSSKVDG